jgi:acetyltransferase-like isoleucine patch superfamily enzyme
MLTEQVSKIISSVRGTPFSIDPRIPFSYIAGLVFSFVLRRFKGILMFPGRGGRVFVGKNCKLQARSLMKLQGPLSINDGCIVNALSQEGISFGSNVTLQRGVVIECTGSLQKLGKGASLGNNVGVGSGSFIGAAGGVEIGDDTIIGNFVSFHSENHNTERLDMPIRLQGTRSLGIRVGKDCWIGAKVTLLDGVNLGDGCIVAAGAVVKAGRYESRSILAGVPARVVKRREETPAQFRSEM